MLVLGFSGGPNAVHEEALQLFEAGMHDSAAVLMHDGAVIAAVEQERLDRIKHSNKAAFQAVRSCLQQAGARPEDVNRFAFYGNEAFYNLLLKRYMLFDGNAPLLGDARTLLRLVIQRELGCDLPPERLVFVDHHVTHAVSAMAMSGFDRALVLTADGLGDDISGLVLDADGLELRNLATLSEAQSLGLYYLGIIKYLGYRIFDEYKVMGLAPYGDPETCRELFETFYTLEPDGSYVLHPKNADRLFDVLTPRRPGEPFTQVHKDVAAALQKSLEAIVLHVVGHWQKVTGHRHLCLAGGVAHNCTMNGRLAYSGLFDEIFVQPASHDAGCALGAAQWVFYQERAADPRRKLEHVYWGPHIGDSAAIEAELQPWDRFIVYERLADIEERAARLLAEGAVIGWAQGRSEFGPRALGNRSILADARPAENKDLINAMVKKREAYRPFAPSLPVERVAEFFELPGGMTEFPFMVFTLSVRPEKRSLLGAITHVDGTARLQTVSRQSNERYWRLLNAFGEITGVPVLLNTSFNNNVEPIVDSVYDALACYLTTRIHYLMVGDFLVRKKEVSWEDYLGLTLSLPIYVQIRRGRIFQPEQGGWGERHQVMTNTAAVRTADIARETCRALLCVNGRRTVEELVDGVPAASRQAVVEELARLWTDRFVALRA